MAMGGGEALRGACGLGPCTSPLCAPWQVCVAGLRTDERTGSHRTTPPTSLSGNNPTPAGAWGPWSLWAQASHLSLSPRGPGAGMLTQTQAGRSTPGLVSGRGQEKRWGSCAGLGPIQFAPALSPGLLQAFF